MISDKELCDVKFYSSPRLEEDNFVCELCLHARLSSLKGDFKVRLIPRLHCDRVALKKNGRRKPDF